MKRLIAELCKDDLLVVRLNGRADRLPRSIDGSIGEYGHICVLTPWAVAGRSASKGNIGSPSENFQHNSAEKPGILSFLWRESLAVDPDEGR